MTTNNNDTASFNNKHEPEGLAAAPRSLYTGDFSNNETTTPETRMSETREIKGLAKQWDEADRMAKNQAKRGSTRSEPVAAVQQPESVEVTAPPQQRTRRLSQSEEKRRATYLSTGMKPGAYPGSGPGDDPEERRFSVAREFASNEELNNDEKDVEVGGGGGGDGGDHPSLHNEGLLVEAFVVTDDPPQENKLVDAQKSSLTVLPTHVQGEFAKATPENKPDVVTKKSAILLIASLIGCFLIGAIVVVVVVMLVVNKDGGDTSSSAALAGASGGNGTGLSSLPPIVTESPMDGPGSNPKPDNLPDVTPEAEDAETPPGSSTTDESASTSNPGQDSDGALTTTSPEQTDETEAVSTTTTSPTVAPVDDQTLTEGPTPIPTEAPVLVPATNSVTTAPEPTSAPTYWPTPGPTPGPAPTPKPTTALGAPTTPPEEPALETDILELEETEAEGLPPLDLSSTARVIFYLDYQMNTLNLDPSQLEMDGLDEAVVTAFALALTSNGVDPQEQTFLASEHELAEDGWTQTVWVDFVYDDLPSLAIVKSALGTFDLSAFASTAKLVGPSFAGLGTAKYSFSIPEYALP